MNRKTLWLTRCGLICAIALGASALEMMLPALPFLPPGAKPGLANIALMAAAASLGPGAAFAVAVVKALFALMMRGATAFLMSLAGGLLSTLIMLLMMRVQFFGPAGIGVGGAVCHNLAQLGVAAALLTPGVVYYLPWMLIFAVLSGLLTGIVFGLIRPTLERLCIKPSSPV